jgi:hypothetical protein
VPAGTLPSVGDKVAFAFTQLELRRVYIRLELGFDEWVSFMTIASNLRCHLQSSKFGQRVDDETHRAFRDRRKREVLDKKVLENMRKRCERQEFERMAKR